MSNREERNTMMFKCDYCENPDLTADMRRHLANGGCALIEVAAGGGQPAFSATVGNHGGGLPELLVIGTSDGDFLRDLSVMMEASGRPFFAGELVTVPGWPRPFKIIAMEADARRRFMGVARAHYGDAFAALQVLIAGDKQEESKNA